MSGSLVFPSELSLSVPKELRHYTYARIGLGTVGVGIPLPEILAFREAHAAAKDALFAPFEVEGIQGKLQETGISSLVLHSEAADRSTYLQRPDLGRKLSVQSQKDLEGFNEAGSSYDVAMVVSDGLSARAVNQHATPVVQGLFAKGISAGWSMAPVVFLYQGRVAAGDPIGAILQAKAVLMLIGERPGLSSPDSMGAYLTYQPRIGLTDESRNCVSNIRPEGLPYGAAVEKLFYLLSESLRKKISGVGLKDEMGKLGT